MRAAIQSALSLTLVCMSSVVYCQAPDAGKGPGAKQAIDVKADPLDVFEQRIMPIFRSTKPSSCVQCHLSSIDLKNYILPSHEKTFASLRDQGLINLKSPEQSKILTLIRMGDKDRDRGAKLIHAKARRAEYEAFQAWIQACCNDPKIRNLPALSPDERAQPDKPLSVIRHTRKSRVLDSFERNVWSQRMRCFPCHTPNEIDPSNPKHKLAMKRQRELQQKYGARISFFKKTPAATLRQLVNSSRKPSRDSLPLINLKDPAKSLLLLKPLSKLPKKKADGTFDPPSSLDPVSHMGGLKMHHDDHSYKSFLSWLTDYSKTVEGTYTDVADLPADNWYPTKLMLRLAKSPEDWPTGTTVQLAVHAWDSSKNQWQSQPMAFTQGTVTPRRLVNGALFLLAPGHAAADETQATSARPFDPASASPTSGRYLVKVYVDKDKRLEDDPTLLLGSNSFAGQAELRIERWQEGFKFGKVVAADQLKSP